MRIDRRACEQSTWDCLGMVASRGGGWCRVAQRRVEVEREVDLVGFLPAFFTVIAPCFARLPAQAYLYAARGEEGPADGARGRRDGRPTGCG